MEGTNEPDEAYWYAERTTLSTLAAAVARKGGLVLEEYGEKKRMRGKVRRGRVDAWFWPNGFAKAFLVEAKQCYPVLRSGREDEAVATGLNSLKKAEEDVRHDTAHGCRRVAIAFVVPRVKVPAGAQVYDTAALKETLRKHETTIDALAWSFYDPGEALVLSDYAFPGVVLLGRVVR